MNAEKDADLLIDFVESVDPDSLPGLTEDALPFLAARMRQLLIDVHSGGFTRPIPPAVTDGDGAA